MEKPCITVVIPVYNAEAFLPRCLDSVREQTLQNIELICVDDGSTDGSLALLRRYQVQDGRIRVLTQENSYAGTARNLGMRAAGGEYLAFLDADDWYEPAALERLYRRAKRHRLDFIKGGFSFWEEPHGRRYTTFYSRNSSVGFLRRGRVLSFPRLPHRLLRLADVPWNGLYRRAFLEAHQIVFNHLPCVNDHSFFIHCLLKADRLMVTGRRVAWYRVGRAQSLTGGKAEHFDAQLESYAIVRRLCAQAPPELARLVLRQELCDVFAWRRRLEEQGGDPPHLEEQLRAFLSELDEGDVGEDFLQTFSFREQYFSLRYGIIPPGGRDPAAARLARCLREHGLAYTLRLLWSKAAGRPLWID